MTVPKIWNIAERLTGEDHSTQDIITILLRNRGRTDKADITQFLKPPDPFTISCGDAGLDPVQCKKAVERIRLARNRKESVVVYADYDADGVSAGTVMWETLHKLGLNVMPYIPHRVEEGYGLSEKGIDSVKKDLAANLIITVDHGITAREKVAYAGKLGIDVIVTDHHVMPESLPDSIIVHTTRMCGAGVAWFLARELARDLGSGEATLRDLLAIAAIGTIADMVPLVSTNRAIAKYGLLELNRTRRVGLTALMDEAGLAQGNIGTYEISHILAPRLNAVGRLARAMDAMRLLCTTDAVKASHLAGKLGSTNKERQQLTSDTTLHALTGITGGGIGKLLFVSHESYNQGVIGLVAGKLVEQYYRPSIVVSVGEQVSKASARSIAGFNIVEAIRSVGDLLLEVGGHPMAAGFSVATVNLELVRRKLEDLAEQTITEDALRRMLPIDLVIPIEDATESLWLKLREFEPFGFGNPEPVFASGHVRIADVRKVGTDGRHLKLRITGADSLFDAIAFGMGDRYGLISSGGEFDVVYTVDMNVWNGNSRLQLKVKDIRVSEDSPL